MMKLTILLAVIAIAQQAYCGCGHQYGHQYGYQYGHQNGHQNGHQYGHNQYVVTSGNTAVQHSPLPNQVSFVKGGQHSCGGCMISRQHILTSAQCVQNPTDLHVVVRHPNAPKGETHKIKRVHVHPEYSGQQQCENNVAVVSLSQPISCNHEQVAVPVATQNYATCDQCTGTISGWGKTSPAPQWYQVNIKTQKSCPEYCQCQRPSTNNQIYVAVQPGQGECTGNAGSPLIVNNEVVGVLAKKTASGEFGCTNVYQHRDFIESCQSSY